MTIQVTVPDVGEAGDVEVIEILVKIGDVVAEDDSLVVLESDKASMEIPSSHAGKVVSIKVKEGDSVTEGSLLVELESEDVLTEVPASSSQPTVASKSDNANETSVASAEEDAEVEVEPEVEPEVESTSAAGHEQIVNVPDVGDAGEVTVTELLVKVGDKLEAEDSIVVLESDKASMEIPTPVAGEVLEILVKDGDTVGEGDALIKLRASEVEPSVADDSKAEAAPKAEAVNSGNSLPAAAEKTKSGSGALPAMAAQAPASAEVSGGVSPENVHAGPAVRKQAREYGVNLSEVSGSGQKGRILKEDVQQFVKDQMSGSGKRPASNATASSGSGIPSIPVIDFSKFGEIELRPLSRVRRSSARNLHRSWLNVPHVTQFDEADITDLEVFRKAQNIELAAAGDKLTPLAFLIKACTAALKKYPQFNSSIDADYEHLTIKKYCNIGIAVETPDGLVVPVIREADRKGVVELARESAKLARQARDKKLPLDAMQGATFSISSLGGIGGTAFTPIVNAPEVAILGVSRSAMKPVWDGHEFAPRMMLPLSLSYDHRAIDGAEAARFCSYLRDLLTDTRRLIL
ncbi:MAG: pyruvate dehydrogenase E2 component (dihydrolipoamide acetyltransferase) [Candidatus Pseudothioglobus sp.]|jgi:pyruvate dehydrogenase E2 component (dihydrolipoamide acetyltransferase)